MVPETGGWVVARGRGGWRRPRLKNSIRDFPTGTARDKGIVSRAIGRTRWPRLHSWACD
jgi:hypothetical protein